ncbi:hypothetical protein M422DRAFT_40935 [Sphaerobolus stellatus SS14]|nr:hypothetical protein M422DRAFT_40935 [Sphaerobolus stellatus SS14]
MVWKGPRNRTHVLRHAQQCSRLPAELRQEANHSMSGDSLGAKVEADDSRMVAVATGESKQEQLSSPSSSPLCSSGQTKLNIMVGKLGHEQHSRKVSLAIIKLFCGAGIPPLVAMALE